MPRAANQRLKQKAANYFAVFLEASVWRVRPRQENRLPWKAAKRFAALFAFGGRRWLIARTKTHEVRTLFRSAMPKAVDGLSRPGVLLEHARSLAGIVDEGTHFVHFRARASVLAVGGAFFFRESRLREAAPAFWNQFGIGARKAHGCASSSRVGLAPRHLIVAGGVHVRAPPHQRRRSTAWRRARAGPMRINRARATRKRISLYSTSISAAAVFWSKRKMARLWQPPATLATLGRLREAKGG